MELEHANEFELANESELINKDAPIKNPVFLPLPFNIYQNNRNIIS